VSAKGSLHNVVVLRIAVAIAGGALALTCAAAPAPTDDPRAEAAWREAREEMVRSQIEARGIGDERVLTALRRVPRHRFVPANQRDSAYADRPLPIGHGQTISQPYIVALMSDLAKIAPGDSVLEIGTGSGYQAAVLAEMGAKVRTIEIVAPLAERSRTLLRELGYEGVEVRTGDGYRGWPEKAPFDAIVVTAAPPGIPEPLKQQLAVGGRLVVPVGTRLQELMVLTRTPQGFREQRVLPVRFVPMTGEAQGAAAE
jgi:protein-L-isoaspartate(D-aspartate) O-methyltransferase